MENWTTLFASPSDCECKDCHSVFSPAAYLVDIMQYLDNCESNGAGSKSVLQVLFGRRPDIGELLLTCENTNTEIPYIDLVNEIMEYFVAHSIDNTIPFTPGDTGKATAEELKAEPQYLLLDAYKAIYQKVYPFTLPYHQPLDVIRNYLKFLKTSRTELMEVFQHYFDSSATPKLTPVPFAAIDAETVQLSLMEYLVLTNTANDYSGTPIAGFSLPALKDCYGGIDFSQKGISLPGTTGFLSNTGLQYTDLLAILETKFINPGQDGYNLLQRLLAQTNIAATTLYSELKSNAWQTDGVFATTLGNNKISTADFAGWLTANFQKFQRVVTLYTSSADCNIDNTLLHSIQWLYEAGSAAGFTKAVPLINANNVQTGFTDPGNDANITANFLSSLHRFVRLWKKTGWTIHELDNMMSALEEIDITTTLIHKLALVNKVNAILHLPLLQLACLWGNIDSYGDNSPGKGNKSLYATLFLKNTGNVTSSGAPLKNIFVPDPLDQILSATDPKNNFSNNLPFVLAALNISSDDFQRISNNSGIDPQDMVTLKNLSAIYRYKLFADAMDISISDLCTLEDLFHPAFGSYVPVSAATTGKDRSVLLISSNVPVNVTGSVQNASPKLLLNVDASSISGINFNIGDTIVLSGTKYSIAAPLPVIAGTPTSITITLERNYTGSTNPKLAASSIQIFQFDIAVTLDFIQKIQKVKESGFDVPELNYIFSGAFKGIDNIALSVDSILRALQDLRTSLLKIDTDNPVNSLDTVTVDLLLQKMQLLSAKDIVTEFVSLLNSSLPINSFVAVPDEAFLISSLPLTSGSKYAYSYSILLTQVAGTFKLNEVIKDANGSTAKVTAISGTTLLTSGLTLFGGKTALEGVITGSTSGATATIRNFSILFQLNGFMTDAERAAITGSANFNSAVQTLYQQSLAALNQLYIYKEQVSDNSVAIPASLIPKYFYTQTGSAWYLQCRGIMNDDEYNQLNALGNAQFQLAVKNIYTYPYSFLKNNFSGFYKSENDLDTAALYLFGISKINSSFAIPAGYTPLNDLTAKVQYFYKVFLPFIIAQLKKVQIVSSVSSLVALDSSTIKAIMDDNDSNDFITRVSQTGLAGSYFNNNNFSDPNPAIQTDSTIDFAWGTGSSLPAHIPSSTSAFSVRWKGWVNAPTDGDYLFTITTGDGGDSVGLFIDGAKLADLTRPLALVGGKIYPITVEYIHNSGKAGIQLFWQSSTMPQAIIGPQLLYSDPDIQALMQKMFLYHRASQFISAFQLSAPEVQYLKSNSIDFANIDFLPVNKDQWLRISGYTMLRKIMPAKLLLPIFQMASNEEKKIPGAAASDDLISAIANANKPKWNKDYLSYVAGNTGNPLTNPPVSASNGYFNYKAKDFKNEIALLQIKRVMDLAIKTKMQVNDLGLPSWTSIETDPATSVGTFHVIGEQIKNAVKGKYKDNWLTIAAQLNNKIRENQKQALISYLLTLGLTLPQPPSGQAVIDANTLFEYLLIDVQMSSSVMTSRLIQATLAVQLFADRCLLGLESNVQVNAIVAHEWEWMKHYSVAAGLKKLFVYVENYLHPSLRDDKSSFFKDFESAIKKNDITDENVENTFRDYLNKLNEVSNMELCGTYHDRDTQTLYVFARTHSAPYNYYFRIASALAKYNSWSWGPWIPVGLDIKSIEDGYNSGVHLMPIIWKKRLFLIWPEFAQKTAENKPTIVPNYKELSSINPDLLKSKKYWEIRFAWSEYSNGKWTPKNVTKETVSPFYDTWLKGDWLDAGNQEIKNASVPPGFEVKKLWTIPEIPCHCFSFNLSIDAVTQALQIDIGIGSTYISTILGLPDLSLASLFRFTLPDITGTIKNVYHKANYESTLIQQTGIVATSGPDYTDDAIDKDNYEPYQPFFENYRINGYTLVIGGETFLKRPLDHKILFSNNLATVDFENDIDYPFFFADLDNDRSYFATPAIIPTRQKTNGTRYMQFNPANWLREKAVTPIHLMNRPPERILQVRIPEAPPSPVVVESVSSPTSFSNTTGTNLNIAAAISGFNTNSSNAVLAFKRSDNSVGSFSDAGQAVSTVQKRFLQDRVEETPAFWGKTRIKLPVLFPGLAFYTFYHPFTSIYLKKLNQGGVAALLRADTAEFSMDTAKGLIDKVPENSSTPVYSRPANDQGNTFEDKTKGYDPDFDLVLRFNPSDKANRNYYLENVDFSFYGTYSSYNWELFFHAPFLIATSLSKNGKYAEARKWFHYIFNPLSDEIQDPANPNSPFWQVLPFKTAVDWEFTDYVTGLQSGYDNDLQIDQWREDPFNAFKIARFRQIAFMKNVVMSYLDNLIAWGDDLFLTYTRESINEATQLYVLAAHILGPAPQYIPERGTIENYSYNKLKSLGLDDFGDVVVQVENAFPNSGNVLQIDNYIPQNMLGIGKTLYFCIPPNEKLLQYWVTIANRLFKIRHGQNIKGVVVPLALYEPPIDPELLLLAKAQGLDVAGILADLESPAPSYRFNYLLQKAKEFSGEVISLGNSLLSVNEKQDAEQLSRLRQTQEIELLNMVTEVKSRQVLEAKANLDNLSSSRITALQRLSHYAEQLLGSQPVSVPDSPVLNDKVDENSSLPQETIINQVNSAIDISLAGTNESGVKVIPKEKQEMDYSEAAQYTQLAGNAVETLAGVFHLLPDFGILGSPLGIGTTTQFPTGQKISDSMSAIARAILGASSFLSAQASSAARMASYIRREQDWVFQANVAAREIIQLDKQIVAAQIRLQMAQHELDNHRKQLDHSNEIEQFLETKFSKQELYQWMIDKLQDVHKQGYQLAYNMARKAEKAYRFELGIPQTNFVQYGYYNDSYSGITAGEQLQLALKQMDTAYIENNNREFELTKHVSLVQLDPLALIQVKETGSCSFALPETLFDFDYPGHYFRRIKSVSISMPCVAGPYTTINSTLRLVKNSIRVNTIIDNDGYPRKEDNGLPANDNRFVENNIPFTAIATSSAQNDSGVFELNFRDERYLPFEGAGVISSWQLELNGKYVNNDDGTIIDLSQFDYETISDILIHIKFTSREEAGEFRQNVISHLEASISEADGSFMRLFSFRHEFPTEWYNFLNKKDSFGNQVLQFNVSKERFPFFASSKTIKIPRMQLFAVPGENSNDLETDGIFFLSPDKIPPVQTPAVDPTKNNNAITFNESAVGLPEVMITLNKGVLGSYIIVNKNGTQILNSQNIGDLLLVVYYNLS